MHCERGLAGAFVKDSIMDLIALIQGDRLEDGTDEKLQVKLVKLNDAIRRCQPSDLFDEAISKPLWKLLLSSLQTQLVRGVCLAFSVPKLF